MIPWDVLPRILLKIALFSPEHDFGEGIEEDLVFHPKKFFFQLADVLQDDSVTSLLALKDQRKNVSPESSMLLPHLPAWIRWMRSFARPLLPLFKFLSVRQIYLDEKFKAELLELYKPSNALLAEEFSLELEKYGYY